MSVMTNPKTAAMGGGGIRPSRIACRCSMPLIVAPAIIVRCGSCHVMTLDRASPQSPSRACWFIALARDDAAVAAAHPVGDQSAVFLRCLLPREVTGVEGMDHAVGEEIVEVLVVRPRHEVVVAARHDLGRRGDRREQITQHWV